MTRMNTYCNGISGNPQCPGCDYCLGSEGGPPVKGYEWVREQADAAYRVEHPPTWPGYIDNPPAAEEKPCTCAGMAFICNRWVFTGRCGCQR